MRYVRKAVSFNVDNAHQRELLEWLTLQSGNFSGYVKTVLYAHMTNGNVNNRQAPTNLTVEITYDGDADAMNDIL